MIQIQLQRGLTMPATIGAPAPEFTLKDQSQQEMPASSTA
jgi:peroxiredoxin